MKEENPDVEMDPGAARLKEADLTEAKKGARVAVKVIEMRGEEAFVVKHV